MDKMMMSKIQEMFPDYELGYVEEEDTLPQLEQDGILMDHIMKNMMWMIQWASLEERVEAAKMILG